MPFAVRFFDNLSIESGAHAATQLLAHVGNSRCCLRGACKRPAAMISGSRDARPARYRNAIVAHIYVDGAADAIKFYEEAFGAKEIFRISDKGGRIVHGEISICGSVIMIGDPGNPRIYGDPQKLGACTAGLHIFTDDNAALLSRATRAGCEEIQPITDMFYGARSGSVRDPFGHVWVLLTWLEELDAAEIERRAGAAT